MTEDQARYARAVSEKWAKGQAVVCMSVGAAAFTTHRAYDPSRLNEALDRFRRKESPGYCIARDGVIMVWAKDQS